MSVRLQLSFKRVALVWGSALAVLIAANLTSSFARFSFGINETDSLPNWAFIVDKANHSPRRGELITFLAPDNPYYPRGARFTKIVWGVPGDRVDRIGRDYFVAGRAAGFAKRYSQTGRATRLGPTGIIPPGRYYVGTPHKDSLDSRYGEIGWIEQSRIIGVARPVL